MADHNKDAGGLALPDFNASSGTREHGTGASQPHGTTLAAPSERARSRARITIIAVIGTSVVLVAIIALVLSQTVFRSVLEDSPTAGPSEGTHATRDAEGQEEYVPKENDPSLAPPPPLFTQAPTSKCHVPPGGRGSTPGSGPNTLRGGGLEFTYPTSWDYAWRLGGVPYLTDVSAQARNIEGSWYSVVNVGRVDFPANEGGYPGLEQAAVTLFQCYATTAGVLIHFGEKPKITDYRTESTTVDGHPAWIVQATYHFENPDELSTTSASVVTSIVVEGPGGASALVSDVAADHEDHRRELDEIIASLKVVG